MVENSGIEPLTSYVQGRRSPSWANSPYHILNVLINIAIKIIYNLYKLDNKKSFECLRLQLN
jgi:hypothetical protein